MTAVVVFLIAGLGTYVIRATMFVVLAGRSLPRSLVTPVSLVGPAAVGALTVGSLVNHGHLAEASTIGGTVAAFVVVRRTGRMTRGLIAGFAVVWLLNGLALL
jgi:branched-subunit amino acid transport protein